MPARWLCDYGQTPPQELTDPYIRRIKGFPWRWIYSAGFACLMVRLLFVDVQLAAAGLFACWALLIIGLADLKYMIIPDQFVIMLAATAFGFIPLRGAEAVAYGVQHGMMDSFFNSMITIGASGAVFGILLAFGMVFPNMPLYLMFIPIPIKAKWMVLGYGAIELFFGISGFQASVAHFAHLGGMIFGFLLLLYWKKKGVIGGGLY